MASVAIIQSAEIDAEKWNRCVEQNINGLIYSRKEYLDALCDNWSGLVVDDYSAVMALPWRRKPGIKYYYEPAFIQQLGLIGEEQHISDIVSFIYSFAKYGDINFNFSNINIAKNLSATQRTNLVMNLSKAYVTIASYYRKDLQLNLKKAKKENLIYSTDADVSLAISLYQHHYQQKLDNATDKDFSNFKFLCLQLQQQQMCLVRKVTGTNGELLAIALLLKDDKRIYNIANTTTGAGRKTEANHFLLDSIIREFSAQNILFDFEGSDLPGVKSFYEKFGAANQPYFHYHHNQLPALLKLFKR